MSTQYDNIGKRYKSFKDLPVCAIEETSVIPHLGNVKGLHCLDLACGLGHWCEVLISQGAASVVGVDISMGMIKAAEQSISTDNASKITLLQGDCSKPLAIKGGPFDLIFAGWFLNYARDFDTMEAMWHNIHDNLKPGGRFVAITPNTFCPMFEPVDDCYGIQVRPIEKVGEGWKCRLTAYLEPESVEFDMYHFLHDFYERAAEKAGMKKLKWHPTITPNDRRNAQGFWDVYLLRPHMTILTASRPER